MVSLRTLIMDAYGVKSYQVVGSQWIDTIHYQVVATMPPNTPREQVRLMLQTLLTQRFGLALRRERREMAKYEMVVGAGGLKLKPEAPDTAERLVFAQIGPTRVRLIGKVSLSGLADRLSIGLGSPVVDKTGLEGIFAIDLGFDVDDAADSAAGGPLSASAPAVPSAVDIGPSLFAALRDKLGLRFEPRRGPVDVLVIEHAEKTPVEN